MARGIKERAEKRLMEKDNRPVAHAKHIRMSGSKIRIILDTVRGKKIEDALALLKNQTSTAGETLYKVFASAAANAEVKGLSRDELFVAECYVCPGPSMKRMDYRAKGRANRIIKRTSHVTVILDTTADVKIQNKEVKSKVQASKSNSQVSEKKEIVKASAKVQTKEVVKAPAKTSAVAQKSVKEKADKPTIKNSTEKTESKPKVEKKPEEAKKPAKKA